MAYVKTYKNSKGENRFAGRWAKANGKEGFKRGFTAKRDAKRYAEEQEAIERKIRAREIKQPSGPITVQAFIEKVYSKSLETRKSTKENYEWIINAHILPKFGKTALNAIKPADVKAWRNELHEKKNQYGDPLKEAYVDKITVHFGMILNCAVDNEYLTSSPMKKVKRKKDSFKKKKVVPLSYEQVEAIAERMGDRFKLIVWICFYTGMRPSEALGLTWDRIDFEKKKITIDRQISRFKDEIFSKSLKTPASYREIHLVDELSELIKGHVAKYGLGPENLLFRNRLGGVWRYRDASSRFRVAARPLGLKVGEGLHILRHTCVSNLIKFGFTPKEIQNWVGHESILETMDTYGHLFPDHYSEIGSELDKKFASLKAKESATSFTTVA